MSNMPVPKPDEMKVEPLADTQLCAQAGSHDADPRQNTFAISAKTRVVTDSAVATTWIDIDDNAQGPENAPIALVEYGDFECPACGQAYPIIKEVQRRMGERLRFVFRHFPLRQIHPHAQRAAEAAECAGAQERFWAMHDTLFKHQSALNNGAIVEYANEIGLDVLRFLRDMKDHTTAERVQKDVDGGRQSGVTGTPTLFINGLRFAGSIDTETLSSALNSAFADQTTTGSPS